jgi:hypothetical protein
MSDIYLQITETPTVVTLSAPVISGALTSTVTVANTVTVALDSNSLSALENVTVTVGAAITGTVTVSNFPATQTIAGIVGPIGGSVFKGGSASTDAIRALPYFSQNGFANYSELSTNNPLPIAGTITIGSLPAISGTVTANTQTQYYDPVNEINLQRALVSFIVDESTGESYPVDSANGLPISGTVTVGNSVTIGSLPTISGTVTANGGDGTFLVGGLRFGGKTALSLDGATGYLQTKVESLPALVAGTAQIGSVTASISNSVTIASLPAISGTVTANLSISSTVITSGSFSSLSSATLVPENPARKMATVFNLGAGQLFVNAGATATTLGGGFMVALSSGDFYECDYTTTTLSAIFATAGTASWMSH